MKSKAMAVVGLLIKALLVLCALCSQQAAEREVPSVWGPGCNLWEGWQVTWCSFLCFPLLTSSFRSQWSLVNWMLNENFRFLYWKFPFISAHEQKQRERKTEGTKNWRTKEHESEKQKGASGKECLSPWGQIKIHNCFLDVALPYKQLV